jgi:hypothetical protein
MGTGTLAELNTFGFFPGASASQSPFIKWR